MRSMPTDATLLRARFLVAMGLPAATGFALSCAPAPPKPLVIHDELVTRRDGPNNSWSVSEAARRWARAAQYEHASVASFARFSLELLALGAPSDLIARAHRAAIDELEHTELALGVARALG